MSRLTWNAAGERFFEAGVDRGVLYLPDLDGVSWPGLISVSDSPSGGDPEPYYIDGIKYLNVASSTEYEATIKAFYTPPEFAICEGIADLGNGLSFTHQRRKSFGFSYRTKLGNDTEGLEHAYKIHLVYNALASPSQRDYTTVNDAPEAATLSWDVTTLPPPLAGFKPTAHIVLDTSKSTPEFITAVEDLLYGTDDFSPSLPTPEELIVLAVV